MPRGDKCNYKHVDAETNLAQHSLPMHGNATTYKVGDKVKLTGYTGELASLNGIVMSIHLLPKKQNEQYTLSANGALMEAPLSRFTPLDSELASSATYLNESHSASLQSVAHENYSASQSSEHSLTSAITDGGARLFPA